MYSPENVLVGRRFLMCDCISLVFSPSAAPEGGIQGMMAIAHVRHGNRQIGAAGNVRQTPAVFSEVGRALV